MLRSLPLVAVCAFVLGAQVPAQDPAERLRAVLPAEVAERVLATIADARSRALPSQAVTALENRALKFAARGVAPADLERAIGEHAVRMFRAREAIESARAERAAGEEIAAGAEAMRQGVDGAAVSALARSAPSGRSLAVPLFVIGSLVEHGLPSAAALQRVQERLAARATDLELETMAATQGRERAAGAGQGVRPASTGRPENVPATGGRPTVPTQNPIVPTPIPGQP
ncbi:MAG: hypothetical protein WD771_11455 [Gemmatimonadaceae bacterium]